MTTPSVLAGRYEIGETLGYGGMSQVHRGRDTVLGRDVAVKIMRPELARDETFYQRFRREAQNSASLNHPSIVAIYDQGEEHTDEGSLPYIVMELVEGDTLRDLIRMDGPMPLERALGVMADVCGALDFSHKKGIIHRDVKPANVMISRDGAVKVMDFGIARAVSDSSSTLTTTSSVLGTAQYLSPEQARGEKVDARSDLYSAGCVLYEMVAGVPPFTGESPVAVAYQHVRESPRPASAVNPEVTRYVDAVVMQAMAKNPENRYTSAGEMRTDLITVLTGGRPAAPLVLSDDDLDDDERPDAPHGFTGAGYGTGRPQQSPSDALTEAHDLAGVTGGTAGGAAGAAAGSRPASHSAGGRRPTTRDDERRRPRGVAIALAVLLVLGGVTAVSLWATSNGGDGGISRTQEVTIPEVAQRPVAEVVEELTALGLEPVQAPAPHPEIPEGHVISSDPIAGKRLAVDSEINLIVSTGKPILSVPNVMGMSPADARLALEEAGFQVVPENEARPSTPEDQDKVVDTDPAPGAQVPSDRPVRLTVGSGPEQVAVPGVVGQGAESARATLEAAGFRVDTLRVDGTAPEGQVVGQSTPAGQSQLKGATITLQVSAGNRFEMPNIVGDTVEEALAKLEQAGWRGGRGQLVELPQNDPDLSRVGRIYSQQPPVGEAGVNDQVVVRVIRFGLVPGPG
ncbi:serine/threonine protein kinase [Dietzia sp. HMSC21D01]|uniref:non-specific serine/threonine protein kinase n=1 Tax=Dietzia cinnamea TaxID=321318 RepID=A0AAW5QCQ0_9ACTN|nr:MULTISPECIES: Stk1 family PASTA domain-containing Ser/Thr kinase [Dietzia]MCT1712222.1 Stk1 family PASTA domain-containing Ser/Thr kinase [Dietzia cinnamea]MCT1865054.1 Stk1 family PASTA domain-containing Ser/Thr kinase [Dietzia cinnamea]MCT2031310.1 Stk1 family PASTA domain-containing Ser/Thr kinase [Dietzia cinnamea]MCT2034768.1 Stk1 family PASTA domain-containing Ser/Thr kinase [Dietzia cinnamea]MCT2077214.1 Stk1 family PASTA domain-containing Ser/Thr kinase [Dietzia cinnamea]